MNEYTSARFPAGIDPRRPATLKAFGVLNSSMDTVNGTILEGMDLVHLMSLKHPNNLNNTASEALFTESS